VEGTGINEKGRRQNLKLPPQVGVFYWHVHRKVSIIKYMNDLCKKPGFWGAEKWYENGPKGARLGNLVIFAAHLSTICTQLLLKLHTYQVSRSRMSFKNTFDLSDSLFSLRLSGFIFRSGNFLPDPVFYRGPCDAPPT
jgi:hypothetical protein